jgi:uncharacterized protein YqgV (UPF0045/DUF77 family)
MFTLVEGEWDEVMAVVGAAVAAAGEGGGPDGAGARVSLVLKADIRPGVTGALRSKVETVERLLEAE